MYLKLGERAQKYLSGLFVVDFTSRQLFFVPGQKNLLRKGGGALWNSHGCV